MLHHRPEHAVSFDLMRSLAATARSDDLSLPVVVEADGGPCAVATDGHVMVAVRTADTSELRRPGRLERAMRDHLEEVPQDAREVAFGALAAWAGEPTWVRPCDDCDPAAGPQTGSGTSPGFARCDDCEGSGALQCDPADAVSANDGAETCEHGCWQKHTAFCDGCEGGGRVACSSCDGKSTTTQPAKRYGWIGQTLINRELLARALACVGRESTVVLGAAERSGVIVAGESWRIVLMPVRPDWPTSDEDKAAPRFKEGA